MPVRKRSGEKPRIRSIRKESMDEVGFAAAVLRQEAHALTLLACGLNTAFCEAVDCLYNIKGRIAVMWPARWRPRVPRPISSTLAKPATATWACLPLGRSSGLFQFPGNTAELSDIVLYAARRNIPLIGVTRNADSLLGNHATHILPLPLVPEADPLDCVPTTSTTLQMVLGDALALTLMRRRGCSPEEFHRWHQGGLAWPQAADDTGNHAHGRGHAPACGLRAHVGCAGGDDQQGLWRAGIITDGDLRRHMGPSFTSRKARQVMHADPVVVSEDTLAVAVKVAVGL